MHLAADGRPADGDALIVGLFKVQAAADALFDLNSLIALFVRLRDRPYLRRRGKERTEPGGACRICALGMVQAPGCDPERHSRMPLAWLQHLGLT
jgi:hypothetical protein